jgi:Uma2 family endonuclease
MTNEVLAEVFTMATTVRASSAIRATSAEQRFLLHDVSWDFYEALLQEIGDRAIRVTYDRGDLELMSPSGEHEHCKWIIGRFIETMADELEMPFRSGGSTTFRSKRHKKGLEADECYYLGAQSMARRKARAARSKLIGPDVAVEIDISRGSIERLEVYAALKVKEVWRYNGKTLKVHVLKPSGQYQPVDRSPTFPWLPLEDVSRFLDQRDELDDSSLVRGFRRHIQAILKSK